MAQIALTVYRESWRVTDEAYHDPSQNSESSIRQFIADPRAAQVLQGLQTLAANQLHTTGFNSVEANVTAVEGSGAGASVSIASCIDSTGTDLFNASGESVRAPLPVGNRIKQSAQIKKFADADGGWLLNEAAATDPYEPC